MADIRAMLRNELAARNTSASASTSTTSQSHLQSTKKRKYETAPTDLHPQSTSSTTNDDVRKRQRSGAYPAIDLDADSRDANAMSGIEETEAGPHHHLPAEADAGDVQETMLQTAQPAPAPVQQNALDDEWALFEQEVIAPTKESDAAAASYAHTFTSIHTLLRQDPVPPGIFESFA
ncbi:hypothetical protein KEM56_007398 [Ascosphaera pollenicola]|nr:hypothetical protein KEM56_007398 [Ascosphaera pollenicola]